VYEGEFQNGKLHGKAKLTTADGVYEGGWKDGKKHGQGKYMRADGDVMEGEHRDGKLHGQCKETTADGAVYEGEYKDGDPTGNGTITFRGETKTLNNWKVVTPGRGKKKGRRLSKDWTAAIKQFRQLKRPMLQPELERLGPRSR
jgi:hypothetical protein